MRGSVRLRSSITRWRMGCNRSHSGAAACRQRRCDKQLPGSASSDSMVSGSSAESLGTYSLRRTSSDPSETGSAHHPPLHPSSVHPVRNCEGHQSQGPDRGLHLHLRLPVHRAPPRLRKRRSRIGESSVSYIILGRGRQHRQQRGCASCAGDDREGPHRLRARPAPKLRKRSSHVSPQCRAGAGHGTPAHSGRVPTAHREARRSRDAIRRRRPRRGRSETPCAHPP